MSSSFDRNRAQLRCETFLGASTPEAWSSADFKNFVLTDAHTSLLISDLNEDSKNFYFKGLLTLCESLNSLYFGLYSWATIKFYYSVYFFLRSSLALNGVALVRQKSLYCLKAITGESPVSKRGREYQTDHKGTINFYSDLFSTSDILLSQSVGGISAYEWLIQRREQVNYRERCFHEPGHALFWDYVASKAASKDLDPLLKGYFKDDYLQCFQEEHATVAIPIKRALINREEFNRNGIDPGLNAVQKKLLLGLVPPLRTELESLLV